MLQLRIALSLCLDLYHRNLCNTSQLLWCLQSNAACDYLNQNLVAQHDHDIIKLHLRWCRGCWLLDQQCRLRRCRCLCSRYLRRSYCLLRELQELQQVRHCAAIFRSYVNVYAQTNCRSPALAIGQVDPLAIWDVHSPLEAPSATEQ